jgi:hypothetical protein
MIFLCAACQIPISSDIRELLDRNLVSNEDGSDFLPRGYYLIARPDDDMISGQGEFVLNLKDTTDKSRLNGCCGLDGLDGINTLCANGHEIGTECSDCWMPHYIPMPPN